MIRIPGKIPIAISPFFWMTAAFIGYFNSIGTKSALLLTLIWVFVIFVSILFHEFGHALAARYFGQKVRIELVAFGGLTYQEGKRLRGWREFLVILNGPLFGFFLFLFTMFFLKIGMFENSILVAALTIFIWVNLFWTIVNLVPVMPLDGGQLLRVVLESIFGNRGIKYAFFFSFAISVGCLVFFFLMGYFVIGVIFFLFAFQNFTSYRSLKGMTKSDQNEDLTSELKEIEELLLQDLNEEASYRLEKLCLKAKSGLVFNLGTQYLASLRSKEGKFKEVYTLLLPIKKHLSVESMLYLHRASYEVKDYPLVVELAGECFRHFPSKKVALDSAEAAAALNQVEATIGWLRAAYKYGETNLKAITGKEPFISLKKEMLFQKFLEEL